MKHCQHLALRRVMIGLTIAGLVIGATGPAGAQFGPKWLPSVETAVQQATKSSKPVYVFVYGAGVPTCVQMGEWTLGNRYVVMALRNYEACRVNAYDRRNEDFLRRHKILLAGEENPRLNNGEEKPGARKAELPVNLFLNKQGREICRLHSYLPSPWFIKTLETVQSIANGQAAVAANPQDAPTYARLGHSYLALLTYDKRLYDKAREHLNKAVALDPHNQTGAKAEAQLDLAIMTIPDAPPQAIRDLNTYLRAYPHSQRRLEATYYLAVAHVAADNIGEAIRILRMSETLDKDSPEYRNPWTEQAAVLLKGLRARAGLR